MRYLLPLLLLLSLNVHAADVTATGVTCNANQPASITIDAGDNRQLFYSITEDNDTPNSDVATIGTISETEVLTFLDTTPTNDHNHTIWIWNEAAVASMSGTTVSGATGGSDNIHCWGVIDDADQTVLGAWDFTSYTGASSTPSVTSTATSSDYVLIAAIVAQSSRTLDDWDTFTERGETAGTASHGLASGVGGDGTTVVTLSSSGETTLTALVFLDGATSNTALLRRRRQ